MKPIILTVLLVPLLSAAESCGEKRDWLQALETQRDADRAGQALSWLTWTVPTSNDRKRLDQQIQMLRLEISQCVPAAADTNSSSEKRFHGLRSRVE